MTRKATVSKFCVISDKVSDRYARTVVDTSSDAVEHAKKLLQQRGEPGRLLVVKIVGVIETRPSPIVARAPVVADFVLAKPEAPPLKKELLY